MSRRYLTEEAEGLLNENDLDSGLITFSSMIW